VVCIHAAFAPTTTTTARMKPSARRRPRVTTSRRGDRCTSARPRVTAKAFLVRRVGPTAKSACVANDGVVRNGSKLGHSWPVPRPPSSSTPEGRMRLRAGPQLVPLRSEDADPAGARLGLRRELLLIPDRNIGVRRWWREQLGAKSRAHSENSPKVRFGPARASWDLHDEVLSRLGRGIFRDALVSLLRCPTECT
jgi:hypothetical protein